MSIAELIPALSAARRTEATIQRLEARAVVETEALRNAERVHRDELLAREEGTSKDKSSKTAQAAADAQKQLDATEQALRAARDRLAELKQNDEAAMRRKDMESREALRERITTLAADREQEAHAVVTALNRYQVARKAILDKSSEMVVLAAKLGVRFEPYATLTLPKLVDGLIDFELGELQVPHGAAWVDSSLPRPSLVRRMNEASNVIHTVVTA